MGQGMNLVYKKVFSEKYLIWYNNSNLLNEANDFLCICLHGTDSTQKTGSKGIFQNRQSNFLRNSMSQLSFRLKPWTQTPNPDQNLTLKPLTLTQNPNPDPEPFQYQGHLEQDGSGSVSEGLTGVRVRVMVKGLGLGQG